jgi:hypothetical protein
VCTVPQSHFISDINNTTLLHSITFIETVPLYLPRGASLFLWTEFSFTHECNPTLEENSFLHAIGSIWSYETSWPRRNLTFLHKANYIDAHNAGNYFCVAGYLFLMNSSFQLQESSFSGKGVFSVQSGADRFFERKSNCLCGPQWDYVLYAFLLEQKWICD